MKKTILFFVISSIVVACSSPDKKAELEKLKKQESELHEKIVKLAAEIGDSAAKSNGQIIDVAITTVSNQNFSHQIDEIGRAQV